MTRPSVICIHGGQFWRKSWTGLKMQIRWRWFFGYTVLLELVSQNLSEKSKLECLRISVITEPCQLIMEAYTGWYGHIWDHNHRKYPVITDMPVSIFPTQRSRKRSQSFLRIFSWNVAGRNGTYDKRPVKGDPLDDGTDQSGRARSTATTNVRM